MWPFSRTRSLTADEEQRVRRRCGLMLGTLRNCLRANEGKPGVCDNLENQVLYCYAEVLAPKQASAHRACFTQAVDGGTWNLGNACRQEISDMKQALEKVRAYPFKTA